MGAEIPPWVKRGTTANSESSLSALREGKEEWDSSKAAVASASVNLDFAEGGVFNFFFQESAMASEEMSCYEGASVQSFQFYLDHSGEHEAMLKCLRDLLPAEFRR